MVHRIRIALCYHLTFAPSMASTRPVAPRFTLALLVRAANGGDRFLEGFVVAGNRCCNVQTDPVFLVGTELCPMSLSPIRTQIHDAFDHVALSLSCTLNMLLQETRARGLHDTDVCYVLAHDETEAAIGQGSDRHFQCFRSNASRIYITRNDGPKNLLASAFEAFAELDADDGKPEPTHDETPGNQPCSPSRE